MKSIGSHDGPSNESGEVVPHEEKGRWERLWPTIACGAGLFSDGYLNSVRIFDRNRLPI